jgi:hypothetical protein
MPSTSISKYFEPQMPHNGPFVPPDIWMINITHDKLSKSKLALLAHRLVTEIQKGTGGHFPLQVCTRCAGKSGIWWCFDTVILCKQCLVEASNLMFDNCEFKIWCYCLSFWILLHSVLFFCVHMAWLTVWMVALYCTLTGCRGTYAY